MSHNVYFATHIMLIIVDSLYPRSGGLFPVIAMNLCFYYDHGLHIHILVTTLVCRLLRLAARLECTLSYLLHSA